jgi:hypothetical protein
MPHYILRNVPNDLWQQAKERATTDGRPLRHVLIDLLRYYVSHGLPPFQRIPPPP